MSRLSDVAEHSSEVRQYMFKGVRTGSFHTKLISLMEPDSLVISELSFAMVS